MATPTSRRAPAADALIEERDALCAELIALEREGAPRVTRAAAIEARLKKIADERGESFKVTLANGDYVRVSPPVAAEFKGNVPVVQTEAWQALKPAEQRAQVKSGLIKVEPTRHRVTSVSPAYAASTRHRVTRENALPRDWFGERSCELRGELIPDARIEPGLLSMKVARINHDATAENEDGDRCSPKEKLLTFARNSHRSRFRGQVLAQRNLPIIGSPSDLSIFPADDGDRGRPSCDRGLGRPGPERRPLPLLVRATIPCFYEVLSPPTTASTAVPRRNVAEL
jgi:hypothetical protein